MPDKTIFFQTHSSTFYCICISVRQEKYGFVCLFGSRLKNKARDRARFLSSQHPKNLSHCLTIGYQLCSCNVHTRDKFNSIDFRVMNMFFFLWGGGGGREGFKLELLVPQIFFSGCCHAKKNFIKIYLPCVSNITYRSSDSTITSQARDLNLKLVEIRSLLIFIQGEYFVQYSPYTNRG